MELRRASAIFLLLTLAAPACLAAELQQDGLEGFARSLLAADSVHTDGFITRNYDPRRVDWSSVISACRSLGQYERRFHNFNIRSAFHDGLAVDRDTNAGGMDASIFTHQEMSEVQNGGFTVASWRVVKTISMKYRCSVADALAVCAAVGVQELSNGRTKVIGPNGQRNFPVGRLDNPNPLPNSRITIIGPEVGVTEFCSLWGSLGFTCEEAVALLGAHSLFDNQGCSKSSKPNDVCDPNRQSCVNQVRMFKWDVHYYHNACTGTLRIVGRPGFRPADNNDLNKLMNQVQCSYSSDEYRQKRSDEVMRVWNNRQMTVTQGGVQWSNEQCSASARFGVRNNCPHDSFWPYTQNDAHLGRACQGLDMDQNGQFGQQVQDAMRRFLDAREWDRAFVPAFIKMVSRFANWANGQQLKINGLECPSGFNVDSGCANSNRLSDRDPRRVCGNCNSVQPGGSGCNTCCRCRSAWNPSRDRMVPEPEVFRTPTVFEI